MSYYDMVYGTNMFGDPTTSYFTAINGTAPIVVTTVGNTATVSHAASGVLPGTYNYGGFTVNSSGHITAATFGPVPLYSVDVKDENVAVVSTSTLNFAGTGVTVTESPAGTALITIPSGASPRATPTVLGTVYGSQSDTAPYTDTYYGFGTPVANAIVAGNMAGFGYLAGTEMGHDGCCFGYNTMTSVYPSGPPLGVCAFGSDVQCGSVNAILIGASSKANELCAGSVYIGTLITGPNTSAGANDNNIGIGYQNSVKSSPGASSVGSNSVFLSAQNSAGIGNSQNVQHTNVVALGNGATSSANDELVTGTQTRLRFPSLTQAASVSTSYPMLWDSSTKVCVPDTFSYGTFSSFTATWTTITQGNGTQSCRYTRFGNLVLAMWKLTWGPSTSIAAGAMGASLPLTAADTYLCGGFAMAYDSSTGNVYWGGNTPIASTTNTYAIQYPNVFYDPTTPFTWAKGDIFTMTLWYRV